ncbi:MAG: endonuclease domain-containing protein [Patescibacteria group bacterium]
MNYRLFNLRDQKKFRSKLRNDSTDAEQKLWSFLRHSQIDKLKFRRQQGIGPYIVDFYCPKIKLVVEIDGDSHFDDQGIAYDKQRTVFLQQFGIRVVRFTNVDIQETIEGVIEEIRKKITFR